MVVTSNESFLFRQTISTCLQAVKPVNIQCSRYTIRWPRSPSPFSSIPSNPIWSRLLPQNKSQSFPTPLVSFIWLCVWLCATPTRHRRTQREESQAPVVLSQAEIFHWLDGRNRGTGTERRQKACFILEESESFWTPRERVACRSTKHTVYYAIQCPIQNLSLLKSFAQ